jgi:rhodanese-related sulfurtransferase
MPTTEGDPHFITPREATARLARRERLAFVDVRTAEHVARSGCRIPGARWVEPATAASDVRGLPRDAVVVVYAEHGLSERPEALTTALRGLGLDARALAGGFAGWSELRCPTELVSGRSPAAAERPRGPGRPALRLVYARP